MLSSILIIYTGGTIGMKTDPATGVLVPFDFRGIYDEFPAIRSLQVRIDVQSLTPVIDSSNVTPALWLHLAELIRDNYARYDGFVVLHGTDTMSYTASALSFLLENLAKPVVFTGSQIPIGVLRTDGRENLITAIEIAAAHDAEGPLVPEVSLYFQNRLFRANRTVKQSAEEFAAFRSYNYPALAEVGVNITFHRDYIHRPAHADAELRVAAALDDRVLVIRLFPGLREQVLRAMLSIEGLRAVVLETYGAGNAPTAPEFIRAVREAVARGLLVMNVTQCSGGRVAMELYETGRQLQEAGVICGHVEDPVDAYTFAHVNDGNAVALPFAKGFGWGGELNLEYIFEKLFGFGHGQGYPKERVVPEQRNKKILDGVRAIAFRDLSDILKDLDRDLVKGAFAGEHFAENFFPACKDEKLAATVKELMA